VTLNLMDYEGGQGLAMSALEQVATTSSRYALPRAWTGVRNWNGLLIRCPYARSIFATRRRFSDVWLMTADNFSPDPIADFVTSVGSPDR
jgi:hypothetical protein